jgi:hypothetical protein
MLSWKTASNTEGMNISKYKIHPTHSKTEGMNISKYKIHPTPSKTL